MKASRASWLLVPLLWLGAWPVAAQPANVGAEPRNTPSSATEAPPPRPDPTPADIARAKESFKAGAAAYAAGEYLAAIQALDAAYTLTPLPAIAFSLAQAERRQYFVLRRPENLRRSITLFRRYVEQVERGGRRSDALNALSQLEPLLLSLEDPAPAPTAPQTRPERSTRLMVISDAPGARIWIDGVDVSGSPLVREVAPGQHRVAVTAPGFRESQRAVVAVAGELIPISMPLVEMPGTLEIQTSAEAEIYVDGVFASEGGERVLLGLPSGTHRVSVVQNGRRLASRRVELERGGTEKLQISLEPTTQRITSKVLMIGSAAAFGAGIAFSFLAVSSEDAAQDFLARRSTENVSNADRVRYAGDVTRRDSYRLIATAGFASSLGLLVTGLFLHELDRPSPEDLNRGGFDVSALVSPDQLGASLSGTF
jgi:hypothetical protein